MSSSVTEARIYEVGCKIIKQDSKKVTVKTYETFSSFFGVNAMVLAVVWNLLIENDLLNRGALHEHLLWGCMLMKQYTGDRVLSKIVDVDPKTFRKWAWHIIYAISWLESEIVSSYYCIYVSDLLLLNFVFNIQLHFF